ncbi:prepilin-type N-terminal cleavage/methylation domain-containing protein [Thermomonas brevis]
MSSRRRCVRAGLAASRQRGFTLIEIIVAFGILALGLTLLLGTLSGATRQLREGGDAGRAALHAQSLLAEHAGLPRGPMQASGELDAGRYRWRLQVEPWQQPRDQAAPAAAGPGAARMLRVQLDIEWDAAGPRQRLQVSSLRLAAAEDAVQ